ncbi:hypothetical protein BDC45DRAFT_529429 [Circinella umbellata]|nr:hypothetical protein BDC45DRAFT_529429 [Circinella umbellata]
MESGFISVKIATAAVVDILKQEQEENEEELLRRKEQDLLLAISVRETEILDSIPFETHYRITLKAFIELVNKLKGRPEYASSQAKDGYPIEIQVTVMLWRLANSMFGFRVMQETLGISNGSYTNFTDRFISAMQMILLEHEKLLKDSWSRALKKSLGFQVSSVL